jgi:hypothetical protein
VFQLQAIGGERLSSDDAAALAERVLERVTEHLGRTPARHNVLRNLGILIVEADAEFLRALIEQPEIQFASPNRTAESPFIPPKGKRPV